MSDDLYKRANAGRLTFKGGELAAVKSIRKSKHKKKKKDIQTSDDGSEQRQEEEGLDGEAPQPVYTIDAAKKMKYEEIFPVETRKFGYDPGNVSKSAARSIEEALDDRVKKKADRYCK